MNEQPHRTPQAGAPEQPPAASWQQQTAPSESPQQAPPPGWQQEVPPQGWQQQGPEGWQQQAPPPGWSPPPGTRADAGLDPKVGALLSYLLFGWIGGLVMFFTQTHREVRFHAAQSIIVFGAFSILSIVLSSVAASFLFTNGAMWRTFSLASTLVNLAAFVLWIVCCIQAYSLNHFKLPLAGDLAERMVTQHS